MKRIADDKVKKHLCNIEGCGKSFERKDHLTNHLNAHSGVRPYSCTYPGCDKSFTQAGSRTKHMLVHSNGKFECSQCKATFRRKPHLDRHTAAVHDTVTPFRCKCGREFASDQGLQIHYRRKHTDDRPFVCSEDGCTATFACSSGRCRHIKTVHKGEKRFECDQAGCNVTCTSRHHLTLHKRAHTGERPFKCTVDGCNAAFALKHGLQNHALVHSGEKRFLCHFPLCGQKFTLNQQLKSHVKSLHSEGAQQRKKVEEAKVAKAFDEAGLEYKREHHVSFGCWEDTFARGDFVMVEKGSVLLNEVDENQHEHYGILCEVARMTKIHTAFAVEGNTLPVGIIRYNPHAFRVDGQLRKVSMKDRLAKLVEVIKNWEAGPDGSLQIQYMYYDCHNVDGKLQLDIWDDSDYSQDVVACCKDPIK